jgi:hypothetical protein
LPLVIHLFLRLSVRCPALHCSGLVSLSAEFRRWAKLENKWEFNTVYGLTWDIGVSDEAQRCLRFRGTTFSGNPSLRSTRRFCFNVAVSTILEKRATPADRIQGIDLADYLIGVHNPPF